MSNSVGPRGLQPIRFPCPSPSPGACSNSCPLSWWCHPTISTRHWISACRKERAMMEKHGLYTVRRGFWSWFCLSLTSDLGKTQPFTFLSLEPWHQMMFSGLCTQFHNIEVPPMKVGIGRLVGEATTSGCHKSRNLCFIPWANDF